MVTPSASWREVGMPWKECSVMDERLRFVSRLLDGEPMTEVCRAFGISRKTGYKIFDRYKEHGLEALADRSRRPVRSANQLPGPIESLIVTCKQDKPHWGARKIREFLVRRLDGDIRIPAKSTIQEHDPRRSAPPWPGPGPGPAASPRHRNARSRPGRRRTTFGAPTSKASSSSATGNTVTHSPSPTTTSNQFDLGDAIWPQAEGPLLSLEPRKWTFSSAIGTARFDPQADVRGEVFSSHLLR
jgi:transposase